MVTKENRTKIAFARQIISALVVMFVHMHSLNSYYDLVFFTKGQTLLLEVENPRDCLMKQIRKCDYHDNKGGVQTSEGALLHVTRV